MSAVAGTVVLEKTAGHWGTIGVFIALIVIVLALCGTGGCYMYYYLGTILFSQDGDGKPVEAVPPLNQMRLVPPTARSLYHHSIVQSVQSTPAATTDEGRDLAVFKQLA